MDYGRNIDLPSELVSVIEQAEQNMVDEGWFKKVPSVGWERIKHLAMLIKAHESDFKAWSGQI